jgi:hypothetical protein
MPASSFWHGTGFDRLVQCQFPRPASSVIPNDALPDTLNEFVELLRRESRSSLIWQWPSGCEDYWRSLQILPLGPLLYE